MKTVSRELFDFYEKNYRAFKLIMEATFDEITITDEKGMFLTVSNSCESIFGRPISEVVGKTCYVLEEEGVFSKSVTKMVLENRMKTTMVQDTGGGRRLIVTGIPMFDDDGALSGVINISRDITEVEKLSSQMEEAQHLLGWYSEELKKRRSVEKSDIVASSASMKKIIETITHIADLDATVLLTGDTGVGKGHIAKAIHNISRRRERPFVQINCGAIPENLLESELFGYEKGAFTGASKDGKKGLFEIAADGTIFLDEIGELPLQLQVKLLTVLEEKAAFRVGGTKPFKVSARIIAATNRDLKSFSDEGRFRSDLYYRLNVMPIHIPALRERPEDILMLAGSFLDKFNEKYGVKKQFSPRAYDAILHHDWPGNTRELENIVERLVITSVGGVIDESHVLDILPGESSFKLMVGDVVPLKQALEEVEERLLLKALEKYGSTRKIAQALEIDQSTVVRKLNKIRWCGGK
ncbi:PAS modulated sigma54 specific transcriptional regulator, Fis family [Peptoclostridium acidaminophilum DSM 3953]|uniref:HTH-type transcriptional regulatory protein TyrR n=1 Tax=Peptoclostridium acidaminophilum DSM 3953 TaxID=1286171 RepID=W8TLZ8_PEPAC|nr:sigma 54-interacting transcriptional regulator [Peptoclostridium acidaminophilum]AHM57202.1 PAS modulated sigma54 specific transcriptional regulator, Fis family [Peptoclostridium acidaminophilum DSM 3953]